MGGNAGRQAELPVTIALTPPLAQKGAG